MYKKQKRIKKSGYIHEQGWKRNDWGAKPTGLKFGKVPIRYGLDTDGDGVPDDVDCKPLDPKRHSVPGTLSAAAIASRQATIQQLQEQAKRNPAMQAQYQDAIRRMQSSLPQTNTTSSTPQRPPVSTAQSTQVNRTVTPPLTTIQRPTQPNSGAIIPQPQIKRWLPNPLAHSWLGKQLGWDK
jgi:hypothetical protein